MNDRTTFIFGAGFSGKAYGQLLVKSGRTVYGTTRTAAKGDTLTSLGIKPIIFDGSELSNEVGSILPSVTDLVISIAPDEAGDPVLRTCIDALLNAPNLKWVGYLSTVGVYGNHDGAWVDEMSECLPVSSRSVQRVAAEKEWQHFASRKNIPLSILRLSGIYGAGRNGLKNMVEGKARRLIKPGQVFNRIHVADIAGALALLAEKRADGIYNVTDDMPAPPQDVVEYAAFVTKIEPPAPIDFETATLSPMARSFYGENKRVSNAKLKRAGYRFQYPDYRTAFDTMWAKDEWR